MKRVIFAWCAAAIVVSTQPASELLAQRPAALPVIVVFNEDASLDGFAPGYRPDERAAANPPAWAYLDRGVAGAVQALEAREQFQADHVFSAALRGFSARLNARQIAALQAGNSDAANAAAKAKGLFKRHYAENTVAEYWAEGTQWWFWSNYSWTTPEGAEIWTPESLKEYDPTLFELLSRVYVDHHIPADIYHGRKVTRLK